jgi:hypothetical protein
MKKKFDAVKFQREVREELNKNIIPIGKLFFVNSRKNMGICKNKRLARTSDNKAYLASVLCTFAQIQLRRTSDTPGAIYSIRKPLKSTHHLLSSFTTLRRVL